MPCHGVTLQMASLLILLMIAALLGQADSPSHHGCMQSWQLVFDLPVSYIHHAADCHPQSPPMQYLSSLEGVRCVPPDSIFTK